MKREHSVPRLRVQTADPRENPRMFENISPRIYVINQFCGVLAVISLLPTRGELWRASAARRSHYQSESSMRPDNPSRR